MSDAEGEGRWDGYAGSGDVEAVKLNFRGEIFVKIVTFHVVVFNCKEYNA